MIDILRDQWLFLLVGQYPNGPMGGLVATVLIAILGLVFSFPCAMLLALARISKVWWLRYPAIWVIGFFRAMPFLMVIFWGYFLLPWLLGRPVGGFATMVVVLVIYESSYLAEVIRAGIEGLGEGQIEAAKSLGLKYWHIMGLVVLPQALNNALPSIVGVLVSIVKETSLGYVISVNEFTFAAVQLNSMLLTQPIQVFSILAITYFLLCFTLTQCARMLEARISRRRLAAGTTVEADLDPTMPKAIL
jgi:polar amino acid transport system permease protein